MTKRGFILLLMLCLFGVGNMQAQEPTTTWPYIFKDFSPVTVYMRAGGKVDYTANIHLAKSTLHYIDGDDIKESKSREILMALFGDRKFMNVNGALMEVVEEREGGFVVKSREIDYTRLNETGGAYGASSNTLSTKALSSIEGVGSVTNHTLQAANKENGKELPLKHDYFIVVSGTIYPAEKSLIVDFAPMDKKQALKDFIKQNKIKWSKPEELAKFIDVLK